MRAITVYLQDQGFMQRQKKKIQKRETSAEWPLTIPRPQVRLTLLLIFVNRRMSLLPDLFTERCLYAIAVDLNSIHAARS